MSSLLITLLAVAILANFVAIIAHFINFKKFAITSFFLGGLAGVGIFVFNWIECGEPPLGNMFHAKTTATALFVPLWLLVMWSKKDDRYLPFFSAATLLYLIGSIFSWSPEVWERPPVLQSVYFVPHVLVYMISYALAAVAFFIIFFAVLRSKSKVRYGIYVISPILLVTVMALSQWSIKSVIICSSVIILLVLVFVVCRLKAFRVESLTLYEKLAKPVVTLAFPFLTFGLALGAIWAEDAWGQYWSWDAKETWALITWFMYAIYFHCKRSPVFKDKETAIHLLAFLALLITFIAVSLLPKMASSMHGYASM